MHESERATVYRGTLGDRRVAVKVRKRADARPMPEPPLWADTPWADTPNVIEHLRDPEGRLVTIMEWLDGHRLIDEVADRVALDLDRLKGVLDHLFPTLPSQHPALRTEQIFLVRGTYATLLGRDTPSAEIPCDAYAAPELATTRTVTAASNAYAFGVILYELLGGAVPFASPEEAIAANGKPPALHARRPGLPNELVLLVEQYLQLDPARRPRPIDVDALLDGPGGGRVRSRKHGYRPQDASEAALLDSLRADFSDAATRQVYADWLEQHGFDLRAERLRVEDRLVAEGADPGIALEAKDPDDAPWRAIASRARIDKCTAVSFSFACPKQWDTLAATAFDDVRFCSACEKPVFFVTSVEEAHARGGRNECIAIDSALVKHQALAEYQRGAEPPDEYVMLGVIMPPPMPTANPPAPRLPTPRKPSLWQRMFGRK